MSRPEGLLLMPADRIHWQPSDRMNAFKSFTRAAPEEVAINSRFNKRINYNAGTLAAVGIPPRTSPSVDENQATKHAILSQSVDEKLCICQQPVPRSASPPTIAKRPQSSPKMAQIGEHLQQARAHLWNSKTVQDASLPPKHSEQGQKVEQKVEFIYIYSDDRQGRTSGSANPFMESSLPTWNCRGAFTVSGCSMQIACQSPHGIIVQCHFTHQTLRATSIQVSLGLAKTHSENLQLILRYAWAVASVEQGPYHRQTSCQACSSKFCSG